MTTATESPQNPPTSSLTAPRRKISTKTSGGIALLFAVMILAVVGLALAVYLWGMLALTMAALCLVPMMFVFFVWISWPYSAAD